MENKPTPYAFAVTKEGKKLPWELGRVNQPRRETLLPSHPAPRRLTSTPIPASSGSSATSASSSLGPSPLRPITTNVQSQPVQQQPEPVVTMFRRGDLFDRYRRRRSEREQEEGDRRDPERVPEEEENMARCRCTNCIEMPLFIENKCCREEDLSMTYITNSTTNICILDAEEIQHAIGEVNVRSAWMRQRRYSGFTGSALAFSIMENRNYRYHAYRSYIDYMHGLLGRFNRRVIPACVVGYIRRAWPSDTDHYTGYVHVNDDGTPVSVDELYDI